jgi:hypothetical protein
MNDETLPYALEQLYNKEVSGSAPWPRIAHTRPTTMRSNCASLPGVFPQTTLMLDALEECDAETRYSPEPAR